MDLKNGFEEKIHNDTVIHNYIGNCNHVLLSMLLNW